MPEAGCRESYMLFRGAQLLAQLCTEGAMGSWNSFQIVVAIGIVIGAVALWDRPAIRIVESIQPWAYLME
jgi:hypothetical protein